MSHLKFSNQIESEVHQTLGAEKIEEICDKHRLQDEGKELLNKVLLSLKLGDLSKDNDLTAEIINRIAAGRPEKEVIKKNHWYYRRIIYFFKRNVSRFSQREIKKEIRVPSRLLVKISKNFGIRLGVVFALAVLFSITAMVFGLLVPCWTFDDLVSRLRKRRQKISRISTPSYLYDGVYFLIK